MSVQNPVAPGAAQGAAATADLAVVSHYINGQVVEGTSGRVRPTSTTRRWVRSAPRGLCQQGRSRSRGRRGGGRIPGVGRDAAAAPRAHDVPVQRTHRARRRPARARSSRPSTARSSPTRRARCSAASRWSSSPAASRSCSRASSPKRSAPASTAGPCGSRSACARASRRSTFPRWCRCGCSRSRIACGNTFVLKPSENDPSARSARASCSTKPGCPTACSTSSTATKRPSTRCSTTRTSQAVSFVGSTPIAEYIYETRHARHGKRVQALGGAKNHMVVMPDADLDQAVDALDRRRLRLGRRALHGDLGRGRGRRPRPTRWSSG